MDGNDPEQRRKPPAFLDAPRCGAKTRNGAPCRNPRVRDDRGDGYRPRCRMHGCGGKPGGKRSGGQFGNKNAVKHGLYTKAALQERGEVLREINKMTAFIKDITGLGGKVNT
jgi:periplasmic glucans biosynthesis protein